VEFVNEFRVPVSIDQAWEVLTDVERVVPCIPGTQLLSVDGDEFTGTVKIKVGPITMQYKGNASFHDKDASAHRAVIRADGKETRGQGNASAMMTAELKDEGDNTSCVLTTDLTISGKAAQFGRGVLSDVATKLIGQFAERLEADLVAGSTIVSPNASPTAEAPQAPTAAPRTDDTASVDLLSVVAVPVAKRVLPVVGALAVGVAIGYVLGRRQ
jgi:carbon monoxide dehydrogenase subunit G